MKASRITAIGLVAAAGLWIASGHLLPHEAAESHAGFGLAAAETQKPFRVAVQRTTLESHRRRLSVSGRTEADRRRSDRASGQTRQPSCGRRRHCRALR